MTSEDLEAIADAVRQAETLTSGEIVVVVDRAAGQYRSVPVIAALVLGLVTPWPLLALTATGAPRIFLLQLVATMLLMGVLLWYGRGGRFVPGFIKRRRAHDAALREFTARGLTRTRARIGVLLYVALQERYAEVLTDIGLDGRVESETWRDVVSPLIEAAKQDRLREGLSAAVLAVGAVLSSHAPPVAGDIDELPNKVVLL